MVRGVRVIAVVDPEQEFRIPDLQE